MDSTPICKNGLQLQSYKPWSFLCLTMACARATSPEENVTSWLACLFLQGRLSHSSVWRVSTSLVVAVRFVVAVVEAGAAGAVLALSLCGSC